MTLVRTSLLNSTAVTVRVAGALVLNKILAVYVGPAGYATIGQFQNVVSILNSLAGGVVVIGVTKLTAQHFDNETKQHAVWQTAVRSSLVASLVLGISLLLFGSTLSQWLLHRTDMNSVFVWLALSLPAMAANNLLLAITNGKKEVGSYVSANILGSLLAVLVTGGLTLGFGLYGALVAFVISPATGLLATGALIARRSWFSTRFLNGRIDRAALKELFGFGIMGFTSALAIPITYMLIRNHLTEKVGLEGAGYWQAIFKVSELYLSLITSTLSVYYLPRLAEIRTSFDLRCEITKVYRFVMPVVTVSAAVIFLLKDFIISTLFTANFSPMREMFGWQLIGDVLKMGSFVPAYIMLGRGLVKHFVITEIVFCATFYLLTYGLVGRLGLQGVALAFAVNSALYWLCMVILMRKEVYRMDSV